MKQFTVKETAGFRLSVKMWKCSVPNDTNAIEFTQECLDTNGNSEMSSTYQFFMTDKEVEYLCKGLQQ